MDDFSRTWFENNNGILEEHKDIEIRQRYCFIFTVDNKIVIVSKNGKDWQFPGGHPNGDETWQETLAREVYEETGLNIKGKVEKVERLGYYLIEENREKFLQERYCLVLNKVSEDLDLEPKESVDEKAEDKIRFAKAVKIDGIKKYVPCVTEAEGWKAALASSLFCMSRISGEKMG